MPDSLQSTLEVAALVILGIISQWVTIPDKSLSGLSVCMMVVQVMIGEDHVDFHCRIALQSSTSKIG